MRYKFEKLRILSDMVRRREELKREMAENKQQLFLQQCLEQASQSGHTKHDRAEIQHLLTLQRRPAAVVSKRKRPPGESSSAEGSRSKRNKRLAETATEPSTTADDTIGSFFSLLGRLTSFWR